MDDLRKPTRNELFAAAGKSVPDIIALNLTILFCGINPGLYSGATGHHFARPGNRFWPTLYAGGFTPRLLKPHEERELLSYGYGITNLVERATAAADELSRDEIETGGQRLLGRIQTYQPRVLAVLGIGAYGQAFARPRATIGRQPETIGPTLLWVLPNPSGLNAHYTPVDFARIFTDFRRQVERSGGT